MTDRAADRELPGAVMAELRGVSKTYGSGGSAVLAVDGVDLSVRAGDCWRCWSEWCGQDDRVGHADRSDDPLQRDRAAVREGSEDLGRGSG